MVSRIQFYDKQFEALREREKAEKMIKNGDYVTARENLVRAQNLFPLENIVSMQTLCHILLASSNHITGYLDYYWLLSLGPLSTTQEIACQYRKLETFLQPIKETFCGTELALRLIQEAFLVLSNSDKRAAFYLRRNTDWDNYESPAKDVSSFPNLTGKEVVTAAEVSAEFEKYSSKSLGKRIELNLPSIIHDRSTKEAGSCSTILKDDPSSSSPTMALKLLYQDFYNFEDDRKIDYMEEGQIWATHYQSNDPQNPRYAQIMTKYTSTIFVMWLKPVPVSDGERRWCEAGLPVACGSFCLDLETGEKLTSPVKFSYKCTWTPGVTLEQFSIYPKKGEVWAVYEDWNLEKWSYNPEATKSFKYKLVEFLSDFSKYKGSDCACLVKVQGFRSIFQRQTQEGIPITIHVSPSMLYFLAHKVPAIRLTGKETDGIDSGMLEVDHLAVPKNMREKSDNATMLKKGNSNGKAADEIMSNLETSDGASYTSLEENSSHIDPCIGREVLGNTQLPKVITTGEAWAIYCGRDSMPRQYVLIDNVISRTQVRVTFLEPEPSTDLKINWKRKNLPIACGTFRAGGTTVSLETSQLSHLVKFEKTMSSYKIYPGKGEIWAMYQRWNREWEFSDQENCQCWILEILSDFLKEGKIKVARLEEVKGCLTFFHRLQLDGFRLTHEISRTEILSFSHRIPFYRVPGIGDHGIPESSFHIDPNGLPPRRRKLIWLIIRYFIDRILI